MSEFRTDDWLANLVETVKALASGEREPAAPRHAATVVLLRDGGTGPEVYMLRRMASMAFAAGAFVFPGGSVDVRDEDFPDAMWVGPAPYEWAATLAASDDRIARALVCAAVRETFEESGVLLAGAHANEVVADTSGDDWETDRLALIDRSLSLAEMLTRRGLLLRADLLHAWAHWITPEIEPRRFDTRFFVAELPSGQRTRDVGGEADHVTWIRPADAIAANDRGEITMLPPTIATLTDLAALSSTSDVVAAAREREVVTVLPKVVLGDNDQVRFLLPHDEGYDTAGARP
ncbi:MAG TPA: NUDIX hydrolase [Mycobacteriales bacterium]|nr:NUDIX hydrolase [Mycobacteriales bacterium]